MFFNKYGFLYLSVKLSRNLTLTLYFSFCQQNYDGTIVVVEQYNSDRVRDNQDDGPIRLHE